MKDRKWKLEALRDYCATAIVVVILIGSAILVWDAHLYIQRLTDLVDK